MGAGFSQGFKSIIFLCSNNKRFVLNKFVPKCFETIKLIEMSKDPLCIYVLNKSSIL